MLQLTAIGRLTKDPEIKQNKKGKDFVVFDLAVNRGSGENQTTTYVSCCAGNFLVSPLSKAKKAPSSASQATCQPSCIRKRTALQANLSNA